MKSIALVAAAGVVAVAAGMVSGIPGIDIWMVTGSTALLAGAILHKAVGLRLDRLTIPGFWYLSYLAMILMPGVVVYRTEQSTGRGTFLIALHVALVAVTLGVALVNWWSGFRREEVSAFYTRPIEDEVQDGHLRLLMTAGLAIGVALIIRYAAEVPAVPLLHMIRRPGDYGALILMREESFKLLDSPFRYAYYVLRTFGMPFLAMVSFGMWLRARDPFWRIMFVVSLVGALVFAALSTAKGPVAIVVLLVFLFLYVFRGGRLQGRTIALGVGLLFLFPLAVVFGLWTTAGVDVPMAVSGILRRIFYDPAWTLYEYFVAFPGFEGHLWGRSIGKLSDIMSWRFFDTPNYVALHVEGSWVASANANAAFVGDLWADFGMAGVVLGSVAAGVLMQMLQVHFVRRPKSVVGLAAFSYVMFACWLLHSTSLPVVLASNGLAVVPFVPVALRAADELLQRTVRSPLSRRRRPSGAATPVDR